MTEMSANLSSSDELVSAPSVEEVRAEVLRLDPQLDADSNTFKTAVVLLSALSVGQDVDDLVRFTSFDRGLVSLVVERMSENGLWNQGSFICDWIDENASEVAFWCDVLVAEGRASFSRSSQGELSQEDGVAF